MIVLFFSEWCVMSSAVSLLSDQVLLMKPDLWIPYFILVSIGPQFRPMLIALMTFSSESSFMFHICCDGGPRFIWSHLKDCHPCPSVGFKLTTSLRRCCNHWATLATFLSPSHTVPSWFLEFGLGTTRHISSGVVQHSNTYRTGTCWVNVSLCC
jgi:hypothetical protein